MPFADRYTETAHLSVLGHQFPVSVRIYEKTDIRNGRHEWGGNLWTSDAPPLFHNFHEEITGTLTFADGTPVEIWLRGLHIYTSSGRLECSFKHIEHLGRKGISHED